MNPRRWWLRRTLRFRITVVATGVALLCLLAFTGLAPALIGLIQITAVDQELETGAAARARRVRGAGGRSSRRCR